MTKTNRQVVQDMKSRSIEVIDGHAPEINKNQVLVRVNRSLVSAGTELNTVNAGAKNLLGMAKARPDLVQKTLKSVRDNGVVATANLVRGKLQSFIPLGYSNVGVVQKVGEGVLDIEVGDRVACAGATWANHAEWCSVPRNLVAKVPLSVTDDEASIVTVAAIAMHGLRESGIGLGDRIGVVGLGLIGLLSTQLAVAAGAEVFAVDPNEDRVEQAKGMGAVKGSTSVEQLALGSLHLDAVLICAHSNDSNLLNSAAGLVRPRGSVVLVGNCDIQLNRDLFFSKELKFSVSRSYGPGRYDLDYEELNVSYPLEYVRWTQTENMKCVLSMLEKKQLRVDHFPINCFPLLDAKLAYDSLKNSAGKCALTMFSYNQSGAFSQQEPKHPLTASATSAAELGLEGVRNSNATEIGFIGLGSHAQAKLITPIEKNDAAVSFVANTSLASSASQARAVGRNCQTSSVSDLLERRQPDVIFVATRHDTHASILISAAEAGKQAIFLEKPLAITEDELVKLSSLDGGRPYIYLNFNRRYSKALNVLKNSIDLSSCSEVKDIYYEINMPPIPPGHWVRNKNIGGGPLLGEACHFVDFCNAIMSDEPEKISGGYERAHHSDSTTPCDYGIRLAYSCGAIARIAAVETTSSMPKEIITIRTNDAHYRITDFCKLERLGGKTHTLWQGKQDKGFDSSVAHFFQSIRGGVTRDDFDYYIRLTESLLRISNPGD